MQEIRRSDLQRIIKEEYARALLKQSGHRITEARINLVVEKLEEGRLDELFGLNLSDTWAGVKAVGKKAKDVYDTAKVQAKSEREAREAKQKRDKADKKIKSVVAAAREEIANIEGEKRIAISAAVDDIAEILVDAGIEDDMRTAKKAAKALLLSDDE